MEGKQKKEFEAEGHLEIASYGGTANFRLNDVGLSELVAFHFGARWKDGTRDLGRCKILIIPVQE